MASRPPLTLGAVLQLGETSYPLCLLDTMALSELSKQPETLADFVAWTTDRDPPSIPAFTVYSVMELRQRPSVFERFIEGFRPLPCVLLKGYAQLLEEEVASYPDPSQIDPVAIAFTPLGGAGNDLANLPHLMAARDVTGKEEGWNASRQEIVDGMLSLVGNYRPKSAKYSPAEIAHFIWVSTYSQLVLHEEEFAVAMSEQNEAVDVAAFPPLVAGNDVHCLPQVLRRQHAVGFDLRRLRHPDHRGAPVRRGDRH